LRRAMSSSGKWISVGRISRAHGIRGELAVRTDDPSTSALLQVRTLRLSGEDALREVVSARAANAEVLLFLRGIGDRNAAEALKGREVEIPREELPAPEPGEFYYADLVGLIAVDESGRELGTVQGIWETGPVPVVVIGEGASELLVPFAEAYVVAVRPEERRIVIRPPEYEE
jgi:16S rRNA processing protein RimM